MLHGNTMTKHNYPYIESYDHRVYLKPLIKGEIFYLFSYNDNSSKFINQFGKKHNKTSIHNSFLDKYGNNNSIHILYMKQTKQKRFKATYLSRRSLKRIINDFDQSIDKPIDKISYEDVLEIFKI